VHGRFDCLALEIKGISIFQPVIHEFEYILGAAATHRPKLRHILRWQIKDPGLAIDFAILSSGCSGIPNGGF
jgi:regulator of PEP synthase PpsR (kinase-PPPase family)